MRSIAIAGIVILAAVASYTGIAHSEEQALVNQYCVTCHSERLKTGNLVLEKLNPTQASANAETWERVIRKVRAGMMPISPSDRATASAAPTRAGSGREHAPLRSNGETRTTFIATSNVARKNPR